MFFVYILKSLKNGKSYVGFTSRNVRKRLEEHNLGTGQWTKQNRPFQLVYYESFVCKTDATRREIFFKSGVGKKLKKVILAGM